MSSRRRGVLNLKTNVDFNRKTKCLTLGIVSGGAQEGK
jgi:hypothetical protein